MSSRRGRGEGSIQQRHDHKSCPPLEDGPLDENDKPTRIRPDHTCKGRWAVVVDHGWLNGSRKRSYVYGATKKEVLEKVKSEGGGRISEWTVERWMNHWLDEVAALDVRPQTLASYRSKTRTYINPLLGKHRLDQLTGEHVEAMLKRMRQPCPRPLIDGGREGECPHQPHHGLSESTLRQTHAILARALKIAVRRRHATDNAARMIDAPSTKTAIRKKLTAAEAKLVLAKADERSDAARWWCALFLGMRQGECLGLPWSMVNFDEGTITIARTVTRVPGGVMWGEPKSESSKRTIPMPQMVASRLEIEWHRYVEATGGEPDLSSLVWAMPSGTPIGHKVDWKRWKALLESAGVPDVSLHSARQTAASLLESAKVPPRLAAEITGHGDVKMLYDYQRESTLEGRKDAMRSVEAKWSEPDD